MPPSPGCLAALLNFFKGNKRAKPDTLPYFLRDDFLSNAELSFFHVLHKLVGAEMLVCPKVSLGDLFYVGRSRENWGYYNKINRKHVDFLLCNPKTLKPVMGIELDDASHRRLDRVERDAFVDEVFATAKLPLVRVPVQHTYNTQELAAQLRDAYKSRTQITPQAKPRITPQAAARPDAADPAPTAPTCPKCSSPMTLRTAKRGKNIGQQFYGCTNYPKCKTILPT